MTTWFVSRHPGAIDWAKKRKLHVDRWVTHLDPAWIRPGDIVIGTLPMEAAATVCEIGARFISLKILLPETLRGKELTAEMLNNLDCTLTEFRVQHVNDPSN